MPSKSQPPRLGVFDVTSAEAGSGDHLSAVGVDPLLQRPIPSRHVDTPILGWLPTIRLFCDHVCIPLASKLGVGMPILCDLNSIRNKVKVITEDG
eukprot:CAMPEP_0170170198 /NCGR_PEP_ID=MMETSP0040_2-20121228/3149_1 /TAXON_ID=641309 /ORGANISM="Lotharella oceanica, Strain CCMP622" /LENGTH=94 /DNA_ID=CAMNT_0010409417 /DNA_START=109 /DNA_END=394 /DNA_ORIENTATION=-